MKLIDKSRIDRLLSLISTGTLSRIIEVIQVYVVCMYNCDDSTRSLMTVIYLVYFIYTYFPAIGKVTVNKILSVEPSRQELRYY